jgi:hypothetical protein
MLVGFWDRKFDVWGGCCSGFLFSNRISNRSNEFSLPDLGFKVVPQLNTVRFSARALCWACLNIVRIDGNVKQAVMNSSSVRCERRWVSWQRVLTSGQDSKTTFSFIRRWFSFWGSRHNHCWGIWGAGQAGSLLWYKGKHFSSCRLEDVSLPFFGFSWFDLTESSLSMLQPENQLYSIIACWCLLKRSL